MHRQWNTEGCHSHLIGADILLAFTFPPSLDTWNQPWFACQMASISWLVRCIRMTSQWITVLIVCQSLIFQREASQRFLFLFIYHPPFSPSVHLECFDCLQREKLHLAVITWNLKCRTHVCVTSYYMNTCQIALCGCYSVSSFDLSERWDWLWSK